jgi:hypothetical protein
MVKALRRIRVLLWGWRRPRVSAVASRAALEPFWTSAL